MVIQVELNFSLPHNISQKTITIFRMLRNIRLCLHIPAIQGHTKCEVYMKKKVEPPLINALESYKASGKIKMHMPGHKGGQGFPKWFSENLSRYDLTEIPGLDNLHSPEDVLKISMKKCAKTFGALKSLYLVNGSTSGIHAMLISAFNKGDRVLVQRDCHQSVINGLILFGMQPVFIMPGYDGFWNVKTPADMDIWEKVVTDNPDIKGAIVTTPDYFGLCTPLTELADFLHEKGKLLLVDEAHGAHFAFSPKLPPTALEQGADLTVQSFHKTLPALTQAAALHIGSAIISENRVKLAVSMLTTTSPSYPIMASMEYASEFVRNEGFARYDELIKMLDEIKTRLSEMKKLRLLSDELHGIKRDPTRIVVDTYNSDLSGYELYRRLNTEYGIVAEMADEGHVVFIVTTSDKRQDLVHLQNSLIELDQSLKPNICKSSFSFWSIKPEKYVMPELSIYLGERKDILLSCSEGYKSAGMITPYPPGIPFLCPGETITKEHIQILNSMLMQKVEIHGLPATEDKLEPLISVMKNKF